MIGRQIEDNLENGQEYVGFIETSYWNLMFDKQVLKTKERFAWHMSFLPQEVVQQEVWMRDLHKNHNYR